MSLKYQVAFLAKGAFTIYVDGGREDFFQVSEKVNKFQQINYLQLGWDEIFSDFCLNL